MSPNPNCLSMRPCIDWSGAFTELVAYVAAIDYSFAVKVIIRLRQDQEAKALPILLRHSPGMVLARRTYVPSEAALRSLRIPEILFKLSKYFVPVQNLCFRVFSIFRG